jgi:RimJ/RimL family protein N-acetyltransferase
LIVLIMFEGRNVNLRRAEKDDVSLVVKWWRSSRYMGDYQDIVTISKAEMEKVMLRNTVFFMIEKKDGTKIGHIGAYMGTRTSWEIGYALIPNERGKDYGSEAVQMMVDHLFNEKGFDRIQAPAATGNTAAQRALEKAGFSKEGLMRKSGHAKGKYIDQYLYSILREEWKTPKDTNKNSSIKTLGTSEG